MPKIMLIDTAQVEETRVAVMDGNRLENFDIEAAAKKQLKGNIYLAKVTRVEPSLQAAFVNYGGNRHGFLPFSEIHPDYYRIPVEDRERLLAEQEELRRLIQEEAEARELAEAEAAARAEAEGEIEEEFCEIEIAAIASGQGLEGEDAVLDAEAQEETLDVEAVVVAEVAEAEVEAVEAEALEAEENAEPAELDSEDDEHDELSEGDAENDADNEGEGDSDSDSDAEGEEGEEGGAAARKGRGRGRGRGRQHGRRRGLERRPGEEVVDREEEDEGDMAALWKRMRRSYKIQEVIKRGQIMLIQVVKEERGNKGAAVTSYITMPGRYCVLMPNSPQSGGVSRKVASHAERRKMRDMLKDLQVPEGMSVILRTAGVDRTKVEIKRDLDYLMRLWDSVRETTMQSSAPALIYEEGDLVKRAIRDLYTSEIDEILVEGDEGVKVAKDVMKMMMPSHVRRVKAYKDEVPLFTKYNAEPQIDAIHSNTVQLKSGGYLVINPTEALVSIDINSGRATRERHIEETALKTNLEAADEIARQLRLRDLGGLVVIDFIDMETRRNNAAVERRMRDALASDRARVQVGRISNFGLLELSRQRLRPSLMETHFHTCPHCQGMGVVRTIEAMALAVLRAIENAGMEGRAGEVTISLREDVALFLFNVKRAHLAMLEARYGLGVIVKIVPLVENANGFVFEVSKSRRAVEIANANVEPDLSDDEDDAQDDADADSQDASAAGGKSADGERDNGRRRRGRRGGRGRRDGHEGEGRAANGAEGEADDADDNIGNRKEPEDGFEVDGNRSGDDEGEARNGRRRRGRRGGRNTRNRENNEGGESSQEGETSPAEEAPKATEVAKPAPRARKAATPAAEKKASPAVNTAQPSAPAYDVVSEVPSDAKKKGWWKKLTG